MTGNVWRLKDVKVVKPSISALFLLKTMAKKNMVKTCSGLRDKLEFLIFQGVTSKLNETHFSTKF